MLQKRILFFLLIVFRLQIFVEFNETKILRFLIRCVTSTKIFFINYRFSKNRRLIIQNLLM